ncbi:oxidative stress-induced growth inhibitor 1-like [Danaus plexippus]|uniref:oxidative stress-induced growth inhibitor 1-like n=1 Tax=Danaus plexippus TaxID=13037 RepID=UPI002AAF9DCB|nr:oxidative stress-induced growth inhibitor 1-like [Danaus plexippus]XP_061380458.1 oxidative stress-induced growth inhibitor 1-like [Danaus plexippus]
MRDMKPCQHTLSDDIVYKEVVVIGNGPSGMVTSFMLAGNVPYLKHIPDDLPIDDMLKARLQNLPPGVSLLETELTSLAEGLEGRSQNPIPLLMDNLLRPCADLGLTEDSLIDWRYDMEKEIDHIVLGKGPPGGAWHTFPEGVRTLSPEAWLTLPPGTTGTKPHAGGRVSARAVAAYCRKYVQQWQLQRYFRSGVVVTGVSPAPPGLPCCPSCPRAARYLVTGYETSECRVFRYLCRRVVLACGGGDRPNTLPLTHTHTHNVFTHSLADVERSVHQMANTDGAVLVVGSGVSAADAVRLVRAAGLRVLHLHRQPNDSLARLPPQTYPDYCQVYKMMLDGPSGNHENYTPFPEHTIIEITPVSCEEPSLKLKNYTEDESLHPKKVKLLNLVTNQTVEITVSLIAVLIGSKPDLFFLHTDFNPRNIQVQDCKCEKKQTQRQCFLKNHWHYIKSVLEQSIQICKSRYLSAEINGNMDTGCTLPDCNKRKEYSVVNKQITPYCQCQPTNPYSGGIGYGADPSKPVDGRSNPIAIDRSTHELLNGPKGVYALGPLTADNFIRFIPGGALAIVAQIHKENKSELN